MTNRKNRYIKKRRKKKFIIKIIFLVIILIGGFAIFACKSNFFIIKKVAILGNPSKSGDEVKKKTEYLLGQNIFFIDKAHIIEEAKKNPYVKSVKIEKSYPKLVNITISEKKAVYYIQENKTNYILSDDLVVLEQNGTIKNRNLIRVFGAKIGNKNVGEKAINDKRIYSTLSLFAKISLSNPTNYKIDSLDLNDTTNIKVYIGEIEGRLGNDENLTGKMNMLLHIIEDKSIGIKKGYIDVGFEGNPVYYKEG